VGGRGMFASRKLKAGETVLEELPLMVIGKKIQGWEPRNSWIENRKKQPPIPAPICWISKTTLTNYRYLIFYSSI
jgi:hypothetical protein